MKYFASGSHDKSIKLYCMQTKKLLTSFLHEKYVFSIAFTNDNKRLISGGGDKVIKIWDLE
jgi:WD40 repeat protein